MNRNLGLNIGILFMVMGIIVMIFLFANDIYLMTNGIKTEGTVYQLYRKNNPNIRLPGATYNIPVIFFFSKDYEKFETWGCPECYKIGDKVPIVYDPKNPSNAEVNSGVLYEPLYYIGGFVIFLVLFIRKKISASKE